MDNHSELWPGWKTVRIIGQGSFGAVYEIERTMLGISEKAALKVITIPQSDSDIRELLNDGYDEETVTCTFKDYLVSIVSEYNLMRKLNGSSNIVSCDDYRYVQHDDGFGWDIFIKMELLTPLAEALPKEIPDDMALQIGIDICKALVLCAKYDIIHRDIKPQNIFVSPNGDYKLGDFGIAKTVEKTSGGTKTGTYKYMAPEVYYGKPYGASADIYSLGLVMYWLLNEKRLPFLPLTGRLNTKVDEEARARRLQGEALPAPAHGSKELKRIVLKACAYDQKERYHTAEEMLKDLRHVNDSVVIPTPTPAPLPVPAPIPIPEPAPVPPIPPTPCAELKRDWFFPLGLARKDSVASVLFMSHQNTFPPNAVDVSAAQDGSVMAWTVKNSEMFDVYVAGTGQISAPENSAFLFCGFSNAETILLSGLDTSQVIQMTSFFESCSSVRKLNLSGFDTSNVENMRSMFGHCSSLIELNLSSFRTPKLENVRSMFNGCSSLEKLDLSSFDTSNVHDFTGMFSDCTKLKQQDIILNTVRAEEMLKTLRNVNDSIVIPAPVPMPTPAPVPPIPPIPPSPEPILAPPAPPEPSPTPTKKMNINLKVAGLAVVILLLLGAAYWNTRKEKVSTQYRKAVAMFEARDYVAAVDAFTALGSYQDSVERANEAKYAYAWSRMKHGDATTYRYLKELSKISYKNSKSMYDSLYQWKVELVGFRNRDGTTNIADSVLHSEYIKIVFRLYGGGLKESSNFYVKIRFPDGSIEIPTWRWMDCSSGSTMDVYWEDGISCSGDMTLTVYEVGNDTPIGEETVTLS